MKFKTMSIKYFGQHRALDCRYIFSLWV